MKVLIAVGGGGHFSPALAVIKQMPKDWDILLVGRKYTFEGDDALSFEYQMAQQLGLPFKTLTTGRLQRKFTKHTIASLLKVPVGFSQAKKILKDYNPDVVLSFGGYVSIPIVLAAAMMRLPIVIHEQILHAGLANKFASRFATKICISWDESRPYFPKNKTVLTGNPLKKEFLENVIARSETTKQSQARLPRSARNDEKQIYITGGSGGAHGINVLIEGCLPELLEKFTVIHQTGDAKQFGDFARLEKAVKNLPEELQKRYHLHKFISPEDVMKNLANADLVISRAGINTVTELLYLGKPCLLIPLPYGQHNEQLTNAEFVKKIGLGEIVDQLSITPKELFHQITDMIEKKDIYAKNKVRASKLIHLDATENIIKEVNGLIRK
jgi:UDP-N-acetylglucosamine--N-acetylmuramyl-(pentapeptide) pyrophosphoryl-undecaprenol N-acetylglucosamine transferase